MPHHDPETDAARETLARLLAACYYEPGPEFAEERVFDTMHEAAARIEPALAQSARKLGDAFAATAMDGLLVDYTRLFLGPTHTRARPYGSAWMESDATLMQASTQAVIELYAQGGFEIDAEFRDLPDHIAAELEFLYLLTFRQNQARVAGDARALASIQPLRRRFLDEHLGRWVAPFAAAVKAGAETAFYGELADLTERFVAMETNREGC